jgi:hypothetical protein
MEKKDLASILIKKTNSYFRKSDDKNNKGYIFDSQINTARKIVLQLGSNVTRRNHVCVVASMQAGKTGTCNSVINIINTSKLYKSMAIKKYMFITGMNDCGLKEQTYIRLKEQVIGASDDNIYIGKRSKKNLSENKYFVLKNSDLLSYEGNIDNTLIFIDESHYGSNEKNILTKFLVKHGIDWKDTNELIKRNIYIVSISATPFDELVSDTVNCKKTIELNTDDNYVGVTEYLKNDLIFDTEKYDITEGGRIFDLIMDAHHRMLDNDEDGAIIIRTRNTETIIENQYVQTHFDVFEMTSSGTKIEYAKFNHMLNAMYENNVSYKRRKEALAKFGVEVESPTTKPLIVIIKGAFRAGITIDSRFKDMIYMVYDSSVKADTTAQALLGRMCGYRSSKDKITNTYFYINKNHANMYSQWEGDFQNKNLIPCDKCVFEWTDNGYKGDDVIFGSRSCGNFALDLTDNDILDIFTKCKSKRNRNKIVEPIIAELLRKNNYHITYDYIGEVHTSGKNNYAKSSQEKRFDSFSADSLVFQFRPEKIKKFVEETNRDYITKDDLGKKCISLVLDATINENGKEITIGGNKRLLVYYVEVGQKRRVFSRKNQYKAHKDTKID